jgi:hypothetical protein
MLNTPLITIPMSTIYTDTNGSISTAEKGSFKSLNLHKWTSKQNCVFLRHASVKGSGSRDPLIVEFELNLRRGCAFNFTSRLLCNRGKRSQNSWVRQRMGPKIGLVSLGKRHISCQLPGIKRRFLCHQDLLSITTSLARLTLWAVTYRSYNSNFLHPTKFFKLLSGFVCLYNYALQLWGLLCDLG